MAEPWYPAAVKMPGVASNYAFGRVTNPVSVVAHFTVGRDSTAIGRDKGYYQFQVNRDGSIYQFSEADSVCWHAGSPYNRRGPGIEVEYLPGYDDEIFTPAAYDATARLVDWLRTEWGIPTDYYDNPAARIGDWNGYISHRSVISDADYHSDYWPELPVLSPSAPLRGDTMRLFYDEDNRAWALWDGINWTEGCDEDFVNALKYAGVPYGNIKAKPLNDLRIVVGAHVEALVQRVAAAVD